MMSKSFKIITQAQTDHAAAKEDPVDWSKCFMCQERTVEHLTDPSLLKGASRDSMYATLACNICRFKEINSLPMKLKTAC